MSKYANEIGNILESMNLKNPLSATDIEGVLRAIGLDYMFPGKCYGVSGVHVKQLRESKLSESRKDTLYRIEGPESKSTYFGVIFNGNDVESIRHITFAKRMTTRIKSGVSNLQEAYAELLSK